MELKVFKDTVAAYGGRWETRVELPVETEILIPDYLPAVFKIVKCLMEPVVLQNRVAAGRWQTEGYLRCTVYYQSDEPGSRLCRTEQKFSFEKSIELPAGQYIEGPARVWGEPEYCNCRAVSEHRIDLRGAYILCGAALAAKDCELLTSLADCGIEQRTCTLQGLHRAAAEEKTLSAETTIPLPGAGESVLDITGHFTPEGATLQTGQVNCKGTLQMQVCYRPGDTDELTVRQKELAIQQTVDLPAAAEGDACIFWGEVLASTLAAGEDDREPALSVTWKLHVELWRSTEHKVVADAYSTLCQTQTVQTSCKLLQKTAEFNTRLPVLVEDEMPDPTATVKGCFVTLGAAMAVPAPGDRAETHLRLAGKGVAHLLCADERGELTCYDKVFAWQAEGEWPGTPADACPCVHAAAVRVNSGKNGTKMRVELELQLTGALLQAKACTALCEVELGEEYDDAAQGPALYLYYAREGERIFDIAKRYHARAKDLAAANKLDAGAEPVQDMTTQASCLLIPAAI